VRRNVVRSDGCGARPRADAAEHRLHHGDDIGWSKIGAYKQGMMPVRTPNLDRLAFQGMTHYGHSSQPNRMPRIDVNRSLRTAAVDLAIGEKLPTPVVLRLKIDRT
jgi:hypothetical protein